MIRPKILFFVLMGLISVSLDAQEPYATILNEGEDLCEKGDITLSIQFFGEAPFGIQYRIGGTIFLIDGTGPNIINIDKLSPENVWESPETIPLNIPEGEANHSVSIEILKVWDKTIDTPWNPDTNGTVITDQEIVYTCHRMPLPFAGEDIDSCGLSAQLSAVPDPMSTTYYWELPSTGTLSDSDDPLALYSRSDEGTSFLTFIQDNGACQAKDTVTVTLHGSPSGILSTASDVCGETSQQVAIDLQLSGNGPWDYSISDDSNHTVTNNTGQPNTTESIFVNGETSFSFDWLKDSNGCLATPEQIQGSVTVIDIKPTPNAGDDIAICGNEVSLGAVSSALPGYWSGPSNLSFDDPSNTETSVRSSAYGTYTLTWTETNGTCAASDQISVRFDQTPTPVDAGKDLTLYHVNETKLSPSPPIAGTGSWSILSGSGTLSSDPFPETKIYDLQTGQTTLLWSVTNGLCPSRTDTLVITVKGITWHTGFSPNGDGTNDTFKILGASHITNNELIIFTRFGKVVYKKKNLTEEGWDGKNLGGTLLDDGTYYFVFTGDQIEPVKDYILIKTR